MSAELGRVFVDTNVLVYVFDSGEPVKQARAIGAVEKLRGRMVVSSQVLSELFVTVTRKLETPLAVNEALDALDDLACLPVVAVDADLVLAAARRSGEYRISHWDALIVEAAARAACSTLLTEDLQHGRRFGDLTVENPFRE